MTFYWTPYSLVQPKSSRSKLCSVLRCPLSYKRSEYPPQTGSRLPRLAEGLSNLLPGFLQISWEYLKNPCGTIIQQYSCWTSVSRSYYSNLKILMIQNSWVYKERESKSNAGGQHKSPEKVVSRVYELGTPGWISSTVWLISLKVCINWYSSVPGVQTVKLKYYKVTAGM